MTTLVPDHRALRRIAVALALLLAAAPSRAADPSPASATDQKQPDTVLELNAFEVRADKDDSYNGLESNSITRFRADLFKLPVTADVFTETFMRDVAATSVEEMVMTYGGASVTSQDAGAGASFNNQPGDRVGSIGTPTTLKLRGLPASVHRDGFISVAPTTYQKTQVTDNFSVERVDVTAGAHSLLYGDSGGGGVINIVSKRARFAQHTAGASFFVDQYGTKRGTLDVNVGAKNVALRFAALNADQKYRRVNLGGTTNGLYAQLAIKLPFRTVLRLSQQDTNSFFVTGSGNGNLNSFLKTGDPRSGLNLDYLIASNQVSDLVPVIGAPILNLRNSDSFKGWTASNWNHDDYSNITVETTITNWLSSQLSFAYDDSRYDSPASATGLTPALTGSNPLPFTAIGANSNPGDSLAHIRVGGFRYSLLATNEFFGGRARSQTLLGGELAHKNGAQNGVQYRYFLLNPDGSVYVNPANLNNKEEGRVLLSNTSPTLWVPVQNSMVAEPFFRPMSNIVEAINNTAGTPGFGTLMKWGRQQERILNRANITPTNKLGADLNGNGEYNIGHTETHAYSLANVTDWFDGRFETLAGLRYTTEYDLNIGPTAQTSLPLSHKLTYSAGLSYGIRPWLRVFTDISSAYNPSAQPNDPLGHPNLPPSGASLVPDVGLKIQALDGRLNATITYAPKNTIKNDRVNIDGTYTSAINPKGINGQFTGTGGSVQGTVNNDQESSNIDIAMTMNLTRGWRTRLAFHETDGSYLKTTTYSQVYNDQFFTNNAGQVTYGQNGAAVMIDPTTGKIATTGGVPLTLALINDPTSKVYAQPANDSGAITNTVLTTDLKSPAPGGGSTAATGATGLPLLSSIQYNWGDPNHHNGVITPIVAGDKTSGYAHYALSFTNYYEFNEGRLKGWGVLTNANAAYQYRSHYYPVLRNGQTTATPFNQLSRQLYLRPTVATFDFGLSYRRKIGRRYLFSTQVNVQNVFNHTRLLFPPSATSITVVYNAYVPTAEPRLWIWTNSIAF